MSTRIFHVRLTRYLLTHMFSNNMNVLCLEIHLRTVL